MQKKSVSVVIPSWNSEKQLQQNLPHVIKAARRVNAEVIVVDDASQHGDAAHFVRSLGSPIKYFSNDKNKGFACTVNKGVGLAKGDIVILLNTDVRPDLDCFTHALKQFADTTVFAVTFNSSESWAGASWHDGLLHHGPVQRTELNNKNINYSLWASGGQAAFDRAKWQQLGGMDTLYKPFYWEDVDLGYRAWKRGWKIIWDPASRCTHDHDTSVIAGNYSRKFITETAQRNQLLFVWKNITDPVLIREHIMNLPRFIKNYPRAFFRAVPLLFKALQKRAQERTYSVMSDRDIVAQWDKS